MTPRLGRILSVFNIFKRGKETAGNLVPPDPNQGQSNPNARGWLNDILTHHWAEQLEIGRVAQAAGYGLNAGERVTKFAGQSTTVNNSGGGIIKGALLTLAAAGIFGPLGYIAATGFGLLNNIKQTNVEQIETKIGPEEYEIDLEVKDGKITPTEVRPVK